MGLGNGVGVDDERRGKESGGTGTGDGRGRDDMQEPNQATHRVTKRPARRGGPLSPAQKCDESVTCETESMAAHIWFLTRFS